MKKLIILLLSIVILIPVVKAEVNVNITDVTLEEKSDNTTIVNEAIYSGLSVKFDLKFISLNDYVRYKIVVTNETANDYEMSFEDISNEYINYEYESESNKINANSETTFYLTITYKELVPDEMLDNGSFVENKEYKISLLGEENPNTGSINYALLLFLAILIFGFIYFKVDSKQINMSLGVLIMLLIIPLSIYALEKLTIKVNSSVLITDDIVFYVKRLCPSSNEEGDPSSVSSKIGNYDIVRLITPSGDKPNNDIFTPIENSEVMCMYKYNAKRGMKFEDLAGTYSFTYPFSYTYLCMDQYCENPVDYNTPVTGDKVYYLNDYSSFTINYNGYTYIKGMTLREWLTSPYNTDNVTIEDGYNYSCENNKKYLYYSKRFPDYESDYIHFPDIIVNYDDLIESINYHFVTVDSNTCQSKTFTINNKEYSYVNGMVWYDWATSKYNTDEYKFTFDNGCYSINDGNNSIYEYDYVESRNYNLHDECGI